MMVISGVTEGLPNPHKIVVHNFYLPDFWFIQMYRFKQNDKNIAKTIRDPRTVAIFHVKYHSKR